MTDTWVRTLLGGVPKSQVLADPWPPDSPFARLGRRIVDVACRCGERLGAVTDDVEEPVLITWGPTVSVRASNGGEPLWSVQCGRLPTSNESAVTHCFNHGSGLITGSDLASAVSSYRQNGRRGRVLAF